LLWVRFAGFLGRHDAIHARHVDVHQNNIGLQRDDFFDGLFTILSITADFEGMPIQKFTNGDSGRQVVIHDKDSSGQWCAVRRTWK